MTDSQTTQRKLELIHRLMECTKRIQFMTLPDASYIINRNHSATRFIAVSNLEAYQYTYAKMLVESVETIQCQLLSQYSARMIRLLLILQY